jgi:hypothetical protein
MNRQTLHAGPARLAVLLALLPSVLAATCLKASSGPTEPEDRENPEQGDPSSSITANVVLADASGRTGTLTPGAVNHYTIMLGRLRVSELSIELWNGLEWLLVTEAPISAAVLLANETFESVLVAGAQLPPGEYTRARLTAAGMSADIMVLIDTQRFSAELRPPGDQPAVLELDLAVRDNDDGSQTLRSVLDTVESLTLQFDESERDRLLAITGDLGEMMGPLELSPRLSPSRM